MLEFTLPLVFTPDDALFFIPSEDNFEEEVRKSLENFADVDFFENIVNDATNLGIEEENKEALIAWLSEEDVDNILKYCTIDMDSIVFEEQLDDTKLEYSVKITFDEYDWEDDHYPQ